MGNPDDYRYYGQDRDDYPDFSERRRWSISGRGNKIALVASCVLFLVGVIYLGMKIRAHFAAMPTMEDMYVYLDAKSDKHWYTGTIMANGGEGYDVYWQSYTIVYKMLREIERAYPDDAKLMKSAKRAVRRLDEPYKAGARQALSDFENGKRYLVYVMDVPPDEVFETPGLSYFRLNEETLPELLDDQGNGVMILESIAGLSGKMQLIIEKNVPGKHNLLPAE